MTTLAPAARPMTLADELGDDMCRALQFGDFLDSIAGLAPTITGLDVEPRPLKQLEPPRPPHKANVEKVGARVRLVASLLSRDGGECWYCGGSLADDMTIEHLTPRALGGSDDETNLVLAHERCNKAVGSLPLAAKEAARAKLRERHAIPNAGEDA